MNTLLIVSLINILINSCQLIYGPDRTAIGCLTFDGCFFSCQSPHLSCGFWGFSGFRREIPQSSVWPLSGTGCARPAALEDPSRSVCPCLRPARCLPAPGAVPDGSGDISQGLTGPLAALNPSLWDFPRRAQSSPRPTAPSGHGSCRLASGTPRPPVPPRALPSPASPLPNTALRVESARVRHSPGAGLSGCSGDAHGELPGLASGPRTISPANVPVTRRPTLGWHGPAWGHPPSPELQLFPDSDQRDAVPATPVGHHCIFLLCFSSCKNSLHYLLSRTSRWVSTSWVYEVWRSRSDFHPKPAHGQ